MKSLLRVATEHVLLNGDGVPAFVGDTIFYENHAKEFSITCIDEKFVSFNSSGKWEKEKVWNFTFERKPK